MGVVSRVNVHDRETTADILADPSGNGASTVVMPLAFRSTIQVLRYSRDCTLSVQETMSGW